MSAKPSIALILAALAALAPFAIDTYLPAFGIISHALNGSMLELQQSLTFYLLPYTVMTLWHGAISDSIGRLTAIKWGLAVFAFASVGCAFAPNVETLWFFRALQGLSGGAGNVVARAMVRDLFEGVAAQRVMAQVQMIFGLAPAIAPIIGGLLLGIHWQAIFVFLALYAALVLWVALLKLPETVPHEKRIVLSATKVLQGYQQVFTDKELLRLMAAVGANFAGFFIYVLAAPVFLLQHLGFTEHQFGWMFVPTVCGMVLGSWLARRAAGKLADHVILRLAYGWMAGCVLLNLAVCYWLPNNPVWNIAPIALYNIGMALAVPVLSVAALDRYAKLRGTVASAQAFIQMLLSTVSAGVLVPLLWVSPGMLAAGAAGYWVLGWWCVRGAVIWQSAATERKK